MTENIRAPARSFLPRWVKWMLGALGTVVLLLAVLIGILLNPFTAKNRHHRMIRQISDHVTHALEPLYPRSSQLTSMSREDRTRYEVLRAINTAIANVLYYPANCSPEKLRAILARLDETKGADLQTGEGCLRLMVSIEDACPAAHDYVWFATLREMQDDGTIARLNHKPK